MAVECNARWLTTELYCRLERDHTGMHRSRGTWDEGGEVEMWWGAEEIPFTSPTKSVIDGPTPPDEVERTGSL